MKKAPRLTKPTTAYKLLSRICTLIRAEPLRYNQGAWVKLESDYPTDYSYKPAFPACGTICCVAGWVETLVSSPGRAKQLSESEDPRTLEYRIHIAARRTLGITNDQALQLFNGDAISVLEPGLDPGTPRYAQRGIEHIKAFQQKHAIRLKRVIVKPAKPEAK